MRTRDIRLGPPAIYTNHRQDFLIAIAIPHRDCSVIPKFNLEAYGILATCCSWSNRRVERYRLPSKNYVIRVLDDVNIVTRTPVGSEIVPKTGNHATSVQPSFRTYCIIVYRRKRKIQRTVGGHGNLGGFDVIKLEKKRQIE